MKSQIALRRAAERRGRSAEGQVAAGWRRRGFDVLAERLRTAAGEIDLVVADAATLVFVEVKARKTAVDAAYAIPPRQQRRLLQAAEAAMAEHEAWQRTNTRFDVVLVSRGGIRRIEDALRSN